MNHLFLLLILRALPQLWFRAKRISLHSGESEDVLCRCETMLFLETRITPNLVFFRTKGSMLTLRLKAGGRPQFKPKLPVVAVENDSAGKVLFSAQPSKVRLNFLIGCDFSTANHSPLHLLGQVEPSRRTISPSESSGSPRLFSKLLSNLTPQLMHLNSRTVLAIPLSPLSAVGQGLKVINQKGNRQYERGSN